MIKTIDFVEEIIIFDYVILFGYDKEVDDDVEADPLNYVEILKIEKIRCCRVINIKWIDFEQSTSSESVYFEFNNISYRVSAQSVLLIWTLAALAPMGRR